MIEVHERFSVSADPETVWRIVSTPEEVVSCIPGATLKERHADGSYSGSILVKFGPARVTFNANVSFDLDEAAKIGRVTGKGKDNGGTRAKMAFTFAVSREGNGSSVAGDGEVDISGPLAGMIEAGASMVIKRMLAEFSAELTARCSPAAALAEPDEQAAPTETPPAADAWWRRLLNWLKARLRPPTVPRSSER